MTTQRSSAVVDLEISNPIPPPVDARRGRAQVLLRLHGRPLGFIPADVDRGRLNLEALIRDILAQQGEALAVPLVDRALAVGAAPSWPDVRAMLECRPSTLTYMPPVTVAVRPSGDPVALRACLESLDAMDYRALDVVVVDDDARAIPACRGEVLIVTDDTVVLDRGWIGAAVRVFIADPDAMAVLGLVMPRRLSSRVLPGSILRRRWHHRAATPATWSGPFVGAFWSGSLGGATGEGFTGQVERLLAGGHTVVYEPAALAWHATQLVADPFTDAAMSDAEPAVRRVDLAETPRSIADAADADRLRLDVLWEGRAIGDVDIAHHGTVVSPFRIQDAIARQLPWQVLDTRLRVGRAGVAGIVTAELARHLIQYRDRARAAEPCPLFVAARSAAA